MTPEIQEAEGRLKADREALAATEQRAAEAISVANTSVEIARQKLGASAERLQELYEAQEKALRDRRARAFGSVPEPDAHESEPVAAE